MAGRLASFCRAMATRVHASRVVGIVATALHRDTSESRVTAAPALDRPKTKPGKTTTTGRPTPRPRRTRRPSAGTRPSGTSCSSSRSLRLRRGSTRPTSSRISSTSTRPNSRQRATSRSPPPPAARPEEVGPTSTALPRWRAPWQHSRTPATSVSYEASRCRDARLLRQSAAFSEERKARFRKATGLLLLPRQRVFCFF